MRTVVLRDPETRQCLMREHIEGVARSIIEDRSGDEVFARYLTLMGGVRRYSVANRCLISWQAPDSRLVASRSAFDRMAAQQGHGGRQFTSRKGRRWTQHVTIAAGAKAVWIWGPTRRTRTEVVTDPETGAEMEQVVSRIGFVPVDVWAIEDVRYVDTGGTRRGPRLRAARRG